MIITSVNNELIKETAKLQQRKYRDESGCFLLEGEKCIEEAIQCGIKIKKVFALNGYEKFNHYDAIQVTESVMSKISTTSTPPKYAAIGEKKSYEWDDNFKKVILLEDIKDAGNLGTIIRTACAFNIDAIILYGDTVDLYNPKCVRSAVGNLWKIPVFNISGLENLKNKCKDFTPVATLPKSDGTKKLTDFIQKNKILVMFGTESGGLSDELKDFAKNNGEGLTIEMSDNVESLNLSISAGIILYKLFTE